MKEKKKYDRALIYIRLSAFNKLKKYSQEQGYKMQELATKILEEYFNNNGVI